MQILNLFQSSLQGKVFLAFLLSYWGGVLTSLTPCVYPLIPVIMAVAGARGTSSRKEAFLISLFFVLGLSLLYTLLGIFASLTGKLFGKWSTHPLTLLIVGNIFLILGLGMLGVYEIKFTFLKKAPRLKKGVWGAFLLGAVSGFVATPCLAPILGAILTYVATQKKVLFGSLLLLSFSLGIGTLFLLVGTFSGILSSLPSSGKWQVFIQKFLGIIMILAGEYFLIQAGKMWLF